MSEETTKLEKKIRQLERENQKLKIQNALLPIIHTTGVLPGAIEDILRRADENFSVTSEGKVTARDTGYEPAKWIKHLKETASHLFADTVSTEGEGEGEGRPAPTQLPPGHLPREFTGQNNPWSKGAWNFTRQGEVIAKFGDGIADRLAALAGVKVGDTKPAA